MANGCSIIYNERVKRTLLTNTTNMLNSEELKSKYLLILEELNDRKSKHITNQDIAESFHADRKTIGHYINGTKINFDFLYMYAEMLGIEIDLHTKKASRN